MAIYLDNPAGRLHVFLTRAKQEAPNQPIRDAWAKALALGPNADPGVFWRHLSFVLALPGEIEEAVGSLPDADPELLLRPLVKARASLSAVDALANPNEGFQRQFDEATLFGLEVCSDVLHRAKIEAAIDEDTLRQIQLAIDDIVTLLDEQDDLDEAVERFIRDQLGLLSRTLLDVRIRGTRALDEVVDRIIGSAGRRGPGYWPPSQGHEDARSRFWQLVERVANLTQTAGFALALVAALNTPAQIPPAPAVSPAGPSTTIVIDEGCASPDDAPALPDVNGSKPVR